MLAITSGDLVLDYVKEGKVITKLLIADEQFNLNYTLADLLTIPKPGEYNGPEEYNVETKLDNEIISALVKAKNALTNSENVVVKPDTLGLGFTFGGDVEYANKVSYYIQNVTPPETDFELTYNSNLLKEILVCNKDMDSGTLHVNSNGLMKIIFTGKNIQSSYYIVAKEN